MRSLRFANCQLSPCIFPERPRDFTWERSPLCIADIYGIVSNIRAVDVATAALPGDKTRDAAVARGMSICLATRNAADHSFLISLLHSRWILEPFFAGPFCYDQF
jgi:hypothetical protein